MNPWVWGLAGTLLHAFAILFFYFACGADSAKVPKSGKVRIEQAFRRSQREKQAALLQPGRPPPEFRDEEIENFIMEGKFREARDLLVKMLRIAEDVRDEDAIKDYQYYEERIDDAEKKRESWW